MVKQRIQKALAGIGVGSRRQVEELVARGEILVNGEVAVIGQTIDPLIDRVLVRGERVNFSDTKTYVALNKPTSYVTTMRAQDESPTVLSLINRADRVLPVGRLDKDTSGLLLLTNDGDWANIVTHPRYMVEKEYETVVRGKPSRESIRHLASGVVLQDGSKTAPALVSELGSEGDNASLSLTLMEGKKRQIRLMCAAIGHPVISLRRVRIGPVELGDLRLGEWRLLREREVGGIREHVQRRAAKEGKDSPSPRGDRRTGRSG